MVSAYVFGRGQCWRIKKKNIISEYNVIGFVDNNKMGVDEDGIRFIHPTELDVNDNTPIIIASGRKNFISMVYQLIHLGISGNRIIFGGNLLPGFDAGELIIHNLKGYYGVKDGAICVSVRGVDYYIKNAEQYDELVTKLKREVIFGNSIKQMWPEPISRSYGLEFGRAVDRHYIEAFLEDNSQYIQGDIIEIEDSTYTYRYGSNIKNSIVIHVDGADDCEKVNIETGEGVREGIGDCFICTQTLQYIYEPQKAANNIYKMLKTSGTALITVPFLAQYSFGDRSWQDYWRYTPQSLFNCLSECFGEANVKTGTFGNIKTVLGFLYGLNEDSFSEDDYNYNDEVYPLVVWAVCHKE